MLAATAAAAVVRRASAATMTTGVVRRCLSASVAVDWDGMLERAGEDAEARAAINAQRAAIARSAAEHATWAAKPSRNIDFDGAAGTLRFGAKHIPDVKSAFASNAAVPAGQGKAHAKLLQLAGDGSKSDDDVRSEAAAFVESLPAGEKEAGRQVVKDHLENLIVQRHQGSQVMEAAFAVSDAATAEYAEIESAAATVMEARIEDDMSVDEVVAANDPSIAERAHQEVHDGCYLTGHPDEVDDHH